MSAYIYVPNHAYWFVRWYTVSRANIRPLPFLISTLFFFRGHDRTRSPSRQEHRSPDQAEEIQTRNIQRYCRGYFRHFWIEQRASVHSCTVGRSCWELDGDQGEREGSVFDAHKEDVGIFALVSLRPRICNFTV